MAAPDPTTREAAVRGLRAAWAAVVRLKEREPFLRHRIGVAMALFAKVLGKPAAVAFAEELARLYRQDAGA